MARYFFDAGTDVACVGIWDASLPPLRNPDPSSAAPDGEVLPIETSADGGYGIAVLVEEAFAPPDELRYETVDREFGLNLTSGIARVGGCEDFRRGAPAITSEEDCVRLTPGWYRVRVHLDRTASDAQNARANEATPEERARYIAGRRRHRVTSAVVGGVLLLTYVLVLLRVLPWGVCLAVTTLLLGPWWYRSRRSAGGQGAGDLVAQDEATRSKDAPDIVLELHRLDASVPGGTVQLDPIPAT